VIKGKQLKECHPQFTNSLPISRQFRWTIQKKAGNGDNILISFRRNQLTQPGEGLEALLAGNSSK
jgi:hypothetical protein